ncbi:MAG: M48 family metallopeptidase [bacterium]
MDRMTWLCGALALGLVVLGVLPWERAGSPWRPPHAEREAAARAHWDDDLIARGREYRSNGYALYFLRKGIVGLLLVATVAFGWSRALRRVPRAGTVLGSTIALVACLVALDIVNIPFGLASLANRKAFGLSTQSLGLWAADHVKGLGISIATAAIVGAALFALVRRFPRAWPLPATAAAGVGGAVYAWLMPIAIAPLFNTFTPLPDEALRARFLDLARRGGAEVKEVLVTDASRRTTSLNAYFSGFGPSRQIVVYDTLVETLTPAQAGLVVAHEVGHWRRSHIAKGIALGTIGVGLALLIAQRILSRARAGAGGIGGGPIAARERWSDPAIVPRLLLVYWALTFVALPIENAISRRFEREADEFAIALCRDPATHIEVEEAMARKNLADVVPPPFIEMLLFSHPATLDRIALAERR